MCLCESSVCECVCLLVSALLQSVISQGLQVDQLISSIEAI